MEEFKLEVYTADGPVVFAFTRIYTLRGTIYFTSAACKKGRHYFHMEERGGTWKIVNAPKPPDWILQYEEHLAKRIKEMHKPS